MLGFQNFINRYFREGCMYEIVADIFVLILDKTGDLPVEGWAPPYLSTVPFLFALYLDIYKLLSQCHY